MDIHDKSVLIVGGEAMLKICEIYNCNKSNRIEVEKSENAYCLKLDGNKIKDGYDNIFIYGYNLFILVSSGKFGAVQYDKELNEIAIVPCEYDTLDEYWHNLVFSKEDEIIYYHAVSREWLKLKDLYMDKHFLYGEDDVTYFIMEHVTGKIILREYKNSKQLGCEPCYVFCGKINDAPEFYDITNCNYISKIKTGYLRYGDKHSLVKPIIINGQNIVSICEKNNKLGMIDMGNRKTVCPKWDEVNVELKVTCKKGKSKKEQVFNIADIKAGDVVPIEEW